MFIISHLFLFFKRGDVTSLIETEKKIEHVCNIKQLDRIFFEK